MYMYIYIYFFIFTVTNPKTTSLKGFTFRGLCFKFMASLLHTTIVRFGSTVLNGSAEKNRSLVAHKGPADTYHKGMHMLSVLCCASFPMR